MFLGTRCDCLMSCTCKARSSVFDKCVCVTRAVPELCISHYLFYKGMEEEGRKLGDGVHGIYKIDDSFQLKAGIPRS